MFTRYLSGLMLVLGIAANTYAEPEIRFTGFTTATFTGGGGIASYTNACRSEYPDSWMCTSEEYLGSRSYPEGSGNGWIKPTFVPVGIAATRYIDYVAVQDISGLIDINRLTEVPSSFPGLSCRGWHSGSSQDRGLLVNASGQYYRVPCSSIRAVACCATAR